MFSAGHFSNPLTCGAANDALWDSVIVDIGLHAASFYGKTQIPPIFRSFSREIFGTDTYRRRPCRYRQP